MMLILKLIKSNTFKIINNDNKLKNNQSYSTSSKVQPSFINLIAIQSTQPLQWWWWGTRCWKRGKEFQVVERVAAPHWAIRLLPAGNRQRDQGTGLGGHRWVGWGWWRRERRHGSDPVSSNRRGYKKVVGWWWWWWIIINVVCNKMS